MLRAAISMLYFPISGMFIKCLIFIFTIICGMHYEPLLAFRCFISFIEYHYFFSPKKVLNFKIQLYTFKNTRYRN